MAKFGSLLPLRLVFFLVWAIASAAAKSTTRSNGGISPIVPGNDRNRGTSTAVEAWVETFSLTKSKREAPPPANLLSKQAFAGSMAFLNGVSDFLCFRMNRCYASMMTGNLIKMASSLGDPRFLESLQFASFLLSYALGCTIYRSMVHFHTMEARSAKPHAAARSTASLLLIALFAVSVVLFYTKSGMGGWSHVVPLTLGFGLLNAATTDALGGTITFAMTGHVSKISQGLSDWMFSKDPQKRHFPTASKLSARILVGYVLGILGGNWLASAGGDSNLPLFSIVGVMAVTLLQLYDRPNPRLHVLWQFQSLYKKTNTAQRRDVNSVDTTINL